MKKYPAMRHAHIFGLIAENLLGTVIFSAIWAAPLAVSVKILVGAWVIKTSLSFSAGSAEGEHQAKTIMAMVAIGTVALSRKLENPEFPADREFETTSDAAMDAYSSGDALVVYWVVQYALWIILGWAAALILTLDTH